MQDATVHAYVSPSAHNLVVVQQLALGGQMSCFNEQVYHKICTQKFLPHSTLLLDLPQYMQKIRQQWNVAATMTCKPFQCDVTTTDMQKTIQYIYSITFTAKLVTDTSVTAHTR